MASDPRIDDLIRQWRERQAQGQPVSLDALCAACPELLSELRKRCSGETVDYLQGNSTPIIPGATISAPPPVVSSGFTTVDSLPSAAASLAGSQPRTAPASVAQLADWIAAQNLTTVSHDELRLLATSFPEQRAFGKEMVVRGWLTPFQINRLLQGRRSELIVGNYVLLEKLGEGGMGVVYKARQRDLKRIVAIKMILGGAVGSSQMARFRLEAEAVARLQHPHIVQIFEVNSHEGKPFFSLEFVEGGTLKEMLEHKPQPARTCALLLETIARAMHAAHQNGILHRDLKPANILMQLTSTSAASGSSSKLGTAVPKIADFGLAKKLDAEASGQTHSGAVMGTPSYMAPEQAAGRVNELGPAADVYALGAILFEALTLARRPTAIGNGIISSAGSRPTSSCMMTMFRASLFVPKAVTLRRARGSGT